MSRASEPGGHRRDSVTVPKIWIAIAVSIVIHTIALWQWKPLLRTPSSDHPESSARAPLIVQLAPPRAARPVPPVPQTRATPPVKPARPARPRVAPPRATPRQAPVRPTPRAPGPPVIALDKPAAPAPRAPAAPSRSKPTPPSAADLLAYVEEQRRSRSGLSPEPQTAPVPEVPSAPAGETANERANRLAAANLGLGRKSELGAAKHRGGGVFEIKRMGYDYAEFMFFGWNKEMRRNTAQVIDVRKGNNSDIQIAVVRRMIAIIRDHEQGDFIWESRRLGRNVTLSARPRDTGGLEAFLMREFFEDARPAARR